jgi:hypothetical protein
MSRRFEFKLFADYYQFYLQDECAEGNLSESWTPEAVGRLLAIAPRTIGVGTARNMEVPVIVEISESAPEDDIAAWDQVNECTLEVLSGRVVVAGCSDYFPDAARIELPPGAYRARIYYGGLNALSADGLNGDDHYKIVLWNAPPASLMVIKQKDKPGTAVGS